MLSNSPGHAGERRLFQATTTMHMADRERCAIPSTDIAAVKGGVSECMPATTLLMMETLAHW